MNETQKHTPSLPAPAAWRWREDAPLIAALLAACKAALPAMETLMCEVTGKHAADWGKVNDAAVALNRAIAKSKGGAA